MTIISTECSLYIILLYQLSSSLVSYYSHLIYLRNFNPVLFIGYSKWWLPWRRSEIFTDCSHFYCYCYCRCISIFKHFLHALTTPNGNCRRRRRLSLLLLLFCCCWCDFWLLLSPATVPQLPHTDAVVAATVSYPLPTLAQALMAHNFSVNEDIKLSFGSCCCWLRP